MKWQRQNGFTLLELLITMGIIMILASIAVPAYKDYRKKAFDIRALSDLKNIATAEELYFLDNEKYFACQENACLDLPSIQAISTGVKILVTTTTDAFVVKSKHSSSDKEFVFDSAKGIIE